MDKTLKQYIFHQLFKAVKSTMQLCLHVGVCVRACGSTEHFRIRIVSVVVSGRSGPGWTVVVAVTLACSDHSALSETML